MVPRAFLLVLVLAAGDAPAVPLEPCRCQDFDVLKRELANARTLRDRFARKAQEIRDQIRANPGEADERRRQFGPWATQTAGQGIVGSRGPSAVRYQPAGAAELEEDLGRGRMHFYKDDPSRPDYKVPIRDEAAIARYQREHPDFCQPVGGASFWKSLEDSSTCQGIADAVKAHERLHMERCGRGAIAYFLQNAEDVADEEAAAYDVQISMIDALIRTVLNGARMEYADTLDLTYRAGPAVFEYLLTTAPAQAAIPKDAGMEFELRLDAPHRIVAKRMDITRDVHCTMAPIERRETVVLKAAGGDVDISVDRFGASSTTRMVCGGGGGDGAAMPAMGAGVTIKAPLSLDWSLTRAMGAEGTPADFGGGMSISGPQTVSLSIRCPAAPPR